MLMQSAVQRQGTGAKSLITMDLPSRSCAVAVLCVSVFVAHVRAVPLHQLRYHEIVDVQGVSFHKTRWKRDVGVTYPSEQHVKFEGLGRHFDLQLQRNDMLLALAPRTIHQNSEDGSYVFEDEAIDNCYYHGTVNGRNASSAAMATCNGLKGTIRDHDGEEFAIEPLEDYSGSNGAFSGRYVLYKTKDVMDEQIHKCGVNENVEDIDFAEEYSHQIRKRGIQQSSQIVDVLTATKYIEVIPIIGHGLYMKAKGKGARQKLSATRTLALEIMNFVDLFYRQLNTRVVLADLIIWDVRNMIEVDSASAGPTNSRLDKYVLEELALNRNLHFDHVPGIWFAPGWGDLVGISATGRMCQYNSVSTSRYHRGTFQTANTVAHEMAHRIGISHYTKKCSCPKPPCMMVDYISHFHREPVWTKCSVDRYEYLLKNNDLSCLLNYPRRVASPPVCGNGLVEANEECDCGTEKQCQSKGLLKCCEPKTCKLRPHAQCAVGQCCHDCKFKQKGTSCRPKMEPTCDVEEFCTGASEKCPDNLYANDGVSCAGGASYCYRGKCNTLDAQCQTIWGPNAIASHSCIKKNTEGTAYLNCGTVNNDWKGTKIKCKKQDATCGKVQCTSKDGKIYSISRYPSFPGNRYIEIVLSNGEPECKRLWNSWGKDTTDPSLAWDGIKCGCNKVCMDQRCVPLAEVSPNNGNGNGNGNAPTKPYIKVGCMKLRGKPGQLLLNKRSEIKWGKQYATFMTTFVKSCAEAAKQVKKKYFGMNWYGRCYAMDDAYKNEMLDKKGGKSCLLADGYYKTYCDGSECESEYECTADAGHYYLYQLV